MRAVLLDDSNRTPIFRVRRYMNTRDTKQPPVAGRATRTLSQGALKLKDACEYLGGISPTSVTRLIKRKQLRSNRTLRHILISVAELDRFLVEGQR